MCVDILTMINVDKHKHIHW